MERIGKFRLDNICLSGYTDERMEKAVRETANFFKALADETRLAMLWLLFENREICVCDLMGALDITQSKASRHLAALRHAGLVDDRREGTWSYYSMRSPEGALQKAQLQTLRAGLAHNPEAEELSRRLRECVECRCRTAARGKG